MGNKRKFATVATALGICAAAICNAGAAAPTGFSAKDEADAVCILAITGAMGSASRAGRAEDVRQIAKLQLYYVGKLKGRYPEYKLGEMLSPDLQHRASANLSTEIRRCAAEIGEVEEDLHAMVTLLAKD